MKKYEKEILETEIKNEKQVLNKLKKHYKESINQIGLKIEALEKRMKVEGTQSIIYRLDYQKALKTEIQGILDVLTGQEYETISDYLNKCYNNSFLGTMYSLQKQGIPLIIPIDQKQVIDAIVHKSKLSKKLYTTLGFNMNDLKKRISSEVSRGITNNLPYGEIARNIENTTSIGLNKSVRIARTEGHRIQGQAQLDASVKAKEKGANVVKQWDASLDGRTRKSHRKLDGQIREVDEYFEVDGKKAMTAGQFNRAEEDVNCRCRVNQRAKWALDEDELEELKKRAEYFGIDKTKDFDDFKTKYLQASEESNFNDETIKAISTPTFPEENGIVEVNGEKAKVNSVITTKGKTIVATNKGNYLLDKVTPIERPKIENALEFTQFNSKDDALHISWLEQLNNVQKNSLAKYSKNYDELINGYLRNGVLSSSLMNEAKLNTLINNLDGIFEEVPLLNHNTITYRGIDGINGLKKFIPKLKEAKNFDDVISILNKGKVDFIEKGFLSTSKDKSVAETFGDIVFKIESTADIPKISMQSYSKFYNEKEVLFGRNQKLELISANRYKSEKALDEKGNRVEILEILVRITN